MFLKACPVIDDTLAEFVDLANWSWNANPWVRGTCQYGVMPSNGLLYVPPDSCACRPEMRLHGFSAMAPQQSSDESGDATTERFMKGPAYDDVPTIAPGTAKYAWSTYR